MLRIEKKNADFSPTAGISTSARLLVTLHRMLAYSLLSVNTEDTSGGATLS